MRRWACSHKIHLLFSLEIDSSVLSIRTGCIPSVFRIMSVLRSHGRMILGSSVLVHGNKKMRWLSLLSLSRGFHGSSGTSACCSHLSLTFQTLILKLFSLFPWGRWAYATRALSKGSPRTRGFIVAFSTISRCGRAPGKRFPSFPSSCPWGRSSSVHCAGNQESSHKHWFHPSCYIFITS